MPARIAAAISAAVVLVLVSLSAATAGADATPAPQHKCESPADPVDKKCDDRTK